MRSRTMGKYELTETLKEKITNAEYEGLADCIDHLLRARYCTAERLECMTEGAIFRKGKELIEFERS